MVSCGTQALLRHRSQTTHPTRHATRHAAIDRGPALPPWPGAQWLERPEARDSARVTERPLAERYWHADITRRGGEFPPLDPLSARQFTALRSALDTDAASVGRRVVVTQEGAAIWFWLRDGLIKWHWVTDAQDRALLTRLGDADA